ncbi:cold shock domain-containing protein [Dongia sp.]|uniref:cold shock domain-containing protein n=1 Tax=Dongia sp. TaxID=1977262 RepID=UPI0035B323D5
MTSPAAESDNPVDGTVVWFKIDKGYGFVKPDDGGADVFVHVAELAASNLRDLAEGQRIRFRRDTHGDGRFFAVRIELIG